MRPVGSEADNWSSSYHHQHPHHNPSTPLHQPFKSVPIHLKYIFSPLTTNNSLLHPTALGISSLEHPHHIRYQVPPNTLTTPPQHHQHPHDTNPQPQQCKALTMTLVGPLYLPSPAVLAAILHYLQLFGNKCIECQSTDFILLNFLS